MTVNPVLRRTNLRCGAAATLAWADPGPHFVSPICKLYLVFLRRPSKITLGEVSGIGLRVQKSIDTFRKAARAS